MKVFRVVLVTAAAVAVAISANLLFVGEAGSGSEQPGNQKLARELAIFNGELERGKFEMPISAGVMYTLLQAYGVLDERADGFRGAEPQGVSRRGTQGCPNRFEAPGTPVNIRVNQDCSLRRQAEEAILENPTDPQNLVAGQNDSRIGFNHCGYDWSFNDGRTWGDMVPPFWQHQLPDGHTSDACSDPTVAFDSVGNVYVGGIIFDVASGSNGVVVAKSNAPNGGTFYHTPAQLPFQQYRNVPLGVVAQSAGEVFHDKELLAADSNPDSPKADNVYMTWTIFQDTNSPIFFSQSTTGGATWSEPVEISGRSEDFCTIGSGSSDPNACDQDQGSHPTVGVDGTVYVAFGNGNVPGAGIEQVLFVWCPPDRNCSEKASWNGPTRVGDLIGTHPIGDAGNPAGCPTGRQCLPPNGYRVPEVTSISASSDNHGNAYVVWSDFRNGDDPGSTCGPLKQWTQAQPPCNNDVFYAFSTDGGETWSETRNVTPTSAFGQSAQWQPWSDVTARGGRLIAAFYDRSYGNCEFDGCNDITAVAIANPISDSPTYTYKRITSGSMPNLTLATNPIQAGFLGDYMWVDVTSHSTTHIVWADTRPHPALGTAPEEDIYYASLGARFGQVDGTQD